MSVSIFALRSSKFLSKREFKLVTRLISHRLRGKYHSSGVFVTHIDLISKFMFAIHLKHWLLNE